MTRQKRRGKIVRTPKVKVHPPLDPDKFIEAFEKGTQAAEAWNIVPIGTKKPVQIDKDEYVTLRNTPMLRMLVEMQKVLEEPDLTVSAVMRVQALFDLAQKGRLGVFFSEKRGIHFAALRAAAEATLTEDDRGTVDFLPTDFEEKLKKYSIAKTKPA